MNPDVLNRLRKDFKKSLRASDPGAILSVSYKGDVVFSEAAGMANLADNRPLVLGSQLDAGSIAKTVTGIAVAMLEDEGALFLDMGLRDVLPEFPAYGDAVTVGHLLHHESGIRDYGVLLYYMTGWHEQSPPTPNQVFHTLSRAGSLIFPPGGRFMYSNSNYFLLARIVERVTNMQFGQFIEQRVLSPLGMMDSAMVDVAGMDRSMWAEGYVNYPSELASPYTYRARHLTDSFSPVRLSYQHVGGGGFRTTTDDLLILGQALAGTVEGLPESARKRVLHAPRVRDDGFGYGHGVNVGRLRDMRVFGHAGEIEGFTAVLTCFPDDDLFVACLTNRQDIPAWNWRNGALDVLLGMKQDLQSPLLSRDRTEREPIMTCDPIGFYMDPKSAWYAEVRQTDEGLGLSLNGEESVHLLGNGPWCTSSGIDVIPVGLTELGCSSLIIKQRHVASRYQRFLEPGGRGDWAEFEGTYACEPLETVFRVDAIASGLRLTCMEEGRPSMDLDYTPTIPDFFWSHDPHPGISQIQFLRDESGVCAFVYRDYDGDRREDFPFVRVVRA